MLSHPDRHSEARERLLATAASLFYAEGIRAVGVDRVVSEARVTRATFYRHFPSKDELVRAYLEREHDRIAALFAQASAAATDPAHLLQLALLGISDDVAQRGFRGCAFINAAAEYTDPAHPVRAAVRAHRDWFHAALRALLVANAHPDPERASRALILLRDGATIGGHLDEPEGVRVAFLDTARELCAAH